MKRLFFVFTFFLVLFIGCQNQKEEAKPPNIVLFFVDDMGWQDTSVPFWDRLTQFNKIYKTPHMERLAKKGVKFTNAYANRMLSYESEFNDGNECCST